MLSRDETYADISPVRLDSNGITAFVSIMLAATTCARSAWCPTGEGKEVGTLQSIVRECGDLLTRVTASHAGTECDSYHFVADHGVKPVTFANL